MARLLTMAARALDEIDDIVTPASLARLEEKYKNLAELGGNIITTYGRAFPKARPKPCHGPTFSVEGVQADNQQQRSKHVMLCRLSYHQLMNEEANHTSSSGRPQQEQQSPFAAQPELQFSRQLLNPVLYSRVYGAHYGGSSPSLSDGTKRKRQS